MYFPEMDEDEVLIFKTFNSDASGKARFTPHNAFDHPNAHENAPVRESIEFRCSIFY